MKISSLTVMLHTDKSTLRNSVWLLNKNDPRQRLLLADDIPEGLGVAESIRAQLGHSLLGRELSPGIQMGV